MAYMQHNSLIAEMNEVIKGETAVRYWTCTWLSTEPQRTTEEVSILIICDVICYSNSVYVVKNSELPMNFVNIWESSTVKSQCNFWCTLTAWVVRVAALTQQCIVGCRCHFELHLCVLVTYWLHTSSRYLFWCSNGCKVQRRQNVSNVSYQSVRHLSSHTICLQTSYSVLLSLYI